MPETLAIVMSVRSPRVSSSVQLGAQDDFKSFHLPCAMAKNDTKVPAVSNAAPPSAASAIVRPFEGVVARSGGSTRSEAVGGGVVADGVADGNVATIGRAASPIRRTA